MLAVFFIAMAGLLAGALVVGHGGIGRTEYLATLTLIAAMFVFALRAVREAIARA